MSRKIRWSECSAEGWAAIGGALLDAGGEDSESWNHLGVVYNIINLVHKPPMRWASDAAVLLGNDTTLYAIRVNGVYDRGLASNAAEYRRRQAVMWGSSEARLWARRMLPYVRQAHDICKKNNLDAWEMYGFHISRIANSLDPAYALAYSSARGKHKEALRMFDGVQTGGNRFDKQTANLPTAVTTEQANITKLYNHGGDDPFFGNLIFTVNAVTT